MFSVVPDFFILTSFNFGDQIFLIIFRESFEQSMPIKLEEFSMTQQIFISVKCPGCGKSLMSETTKIGEHPAIELEAKLGEKVGKILLSPEYGDYHKKFENLNDQVGSIAILSCVHCHEPLPVVQLCDCKAPMVGLQLKVGGTIKICSRSGCKRHSLEFEDVNDAFTLLMRQDETGLG